MIFQGIILHSLVTLQTSCTAVLSMQVCNPYNEWDSTAVRCVLSCTPLSDVHSLQYLNYACFLFLCVLGSGLEARFLHFGTLLLANVFSELLEWLSQYLKVLKSSINFSTENNVQHLSMLYSVKSLEATALRLVFLYSSTSQQKDPTIETFTFLLL